jgi:hypothetical protein
VEVGHALVEPQGYVKVSRRLVELVQILLAVPTPMEGVNVERSPGQIGAEVVCRLLPALQLEECLAALEVRLGVDWLENEG